MRVATDLHLAGIYHRFLTKDRNFVVGRDGRPRIINLSHARFHTCAGTHSEYLGSLRMIRNQWVSTLKGCPELLKLDEHLGLPHENHDESLLQDSS